MSAYMYDELAGAYNRERRLRAEAEKRAEAAEARVAALEEILGLAEGLTMLHKVESDDDPESCADMTGFDAIDCEACIFNVARGKPDRRDPAKVERA